MMKLKELLRNIQPIKVLGSEDCIVQGLTQNANATQAGDIFFAIKGNRYNGHDFIDIAIGNGAQVIVCEHISQPKEGVTYVQVEDSVRALALISSAFYGNPSEKLTLVGITGTNGKTTTATLLYELFQELGKPAGLISTLAIYVGKERFETQNTTPDALTLNRFLKQMVDQGIQYCFMEVSSHGVAMQRIAGLHFALAAFTNLTHDHLDFHKNFADYRDTKKRFFDNLSPNAIALTNADDKNGAFMLQNTRAKKSTYALKTIADYKGQILENSLNGLALKIGNFEVWTHFVGLFNAYNLLCVFACADLLGIDPLDILQAISKLTPVQGRFQLTTSKTGVTAIVDYAHTPDALQNVLKTIWDVSTGTGKIITVVGCGGNRDRQKRPIMGKIAAELSHIAIFTADNPRDEPTELILKQMEEGVPPADSHKVTLIPDREQAIKTACLLAQKNDVILIAGKGHETYQEIKGKRLHFSDWEQVNKYLTEKQ